MVGRSSSAAAAADASAGSVRKGQSSGKCRKRGRAVLPSRLEVFLLAKFRHSSGFRHLPMRRDVSLSRHHPLVYKMSLPGYTQIPKEDQGAWSTTSPEDDESAQNDESAQKPTTTTYPPSRPHITFRAFATSLLIWQCTCSMEGSCCSPER
jgi:hypothetical protein